MKAERYVAERHYDDFCKWLRFYEMGPTDPSFLPATGFVVEGLACCFLYRTDSKVALIEGIVGNPYAPKADASEAIDAVVQATIAEARAQGFGVLQGYTTFEVLAKRALRHGFTIDDARYHLASIVL